MEPKNVVEGLISLSKLASKLFPKRGETKIEAPASGGAIASVAHGLDSNNPRELLAFFALLAFLALLAVIVGTTIRQA